MLRLELIRVGKVAIIDYLNQWCPGARPTNDISIEFEIRTELGAL